MLTYHTTYHEAHTGEAAVEPIIVVNRHTHVSVVFLLVLSQLWRYTGGSNGEDVALCVDASEDQVVISGYTTGDLYSQNSGEHRTPAGLNEHTL